MNQDVVLRLRCVQRIAEADARHVTRIDQPLADEEPDRELIVVARRPHRDGNLCWLSVWPGNGDLRRLFADEQVVTFDGGPVTPCDDAMRGCATTRIGWCAHLEIVVACCRTG